MISQKKSVFFIISFDFCFDQKRKLANVEFIQSNVKTSNSEEFK